MSPQERGLSDSYQQHDLQTSQTRQVDALHAVFFERGMPDAARTLSRRSESNPMIRGVREAARAASESTGSSISARLSGFDQLINLAQGVPFRSYRLSEDELNGLASSIGHRLGNELFSSTTPTMQSFLNRHLFTDENLRSFAQDSGMTGDQMRQFLDRAAAGASPVELRGILNRSAGFGNLPAQFSSTIFLSGLASLSSEQRIETIGAAAGRVAQR